MVQQGQVQAERGTGDTHHMFRLFTGEKARGAVATTISGIIANLGNTLAILGLGLNPVLSTLLFLQVFGNLTTYVLDILLAKRTFGGVDVPYSDLRTRWAWCVGSFVRPPIHKFVVAAIIEGVIVSLGLTRARKECDKHGIKFKLRDPLLAAAIAAISFLLFMNVLRFNWVLDENESLVLNIVVLAWMGVSLTVLLADSKAPLLASAPITSSATATATPPATAVKT